MDCCSRNTERKKQKVLVFEFQNRLLNSEQRQIVLKIKAFVWIEDTQEAILEEVWGRLEESCIKVQPVIRWASCWGFCLRAWLGRDLEPQHEVASALLSSRASRAVGNVWAESWPQGLTHPGDMEEQLLFLCPVKTMEVGTQRKNETKVASREGCPGLATEMLGDHRMTRWGPSSQGSQENKLLLHLMHCGGGWLAEDQTR